MPKPCCPFRTRNVVIGVGAPCGPTRSGLGALTLRRRQWLDWWQAGWRHSRSASALLVRRCRVRLLRGGVADITWRDYLAAEGQMMTVPEIPPEVQQQAEARVAGPAAEVLERL